MNGVPPTFSYPETVLLGHEHPVPTSGQGWRRTGLFINSHVFPFSIAAWRETWRRNWPTTKMKRLGVSYERRYILSKGARAQTRARGFILSLLHEAWLTSRRLEMSAHWAHGPWSHRAHRPLLKASQLAHGLPYSPRAEQQGIPQGNHTEQRNKGCQCTSTPRKIIDVFEYMFVFHPKTKPTLGFHKAIRTKPVILTHSSVSSSCMIYTGFK